MSWSRRHPVANSASFVVLGVFFAVTLSLSWRSQAESGRVGDDRNRTAEDAGTQGTATARA
jgi:hypothetical protein